MDWSKSILGWVGAFGVVYIGTIPGADSGGEGKSSRHFFPARLDFLSSPLSAPGSALIYWERSRV